MKTVLTKEEIESMFNPTATAEYIGDIFEFWLGILDLGIQFPIMFGGWGQTLIVASQNWKNYSGFTAVHVDLPTPSIRSEIAPGKHTFHQSKMRW